MQGGNGRYTGPVINLAYPGQTREEAAAIEQHKGECLAQYRARWELCEPVLNQGKDYARQWLAVQAGDVRELYRDMLNAIQAFRKRQQEKRGRR